MKSIPYFLLLFTFFLGLEAKAQIDTARKSSGQQTSIQLNLGTQGIGAELIHGLSSQFAIRAGANIIPIKANDIFKFDDFKSKTNASADFYNVHALADFSPFAGFRLVGGVAYFFKAEGNINIRPSDDYTYGDIVLNEEQIGHVDLNVDWKGVAPYFGIALGRAIPKKKFNVNFDLGTYYLTKPKTDIIGTGLLKGNSSQSAQLQSNLQDYRWLPVVQLNFNFKL